MLIKRFVSRTARTGARMADLLARKLSTTATYLRLGPRGYREHKDAERDVQAATIAAAEQTGSTFANGLTTSFTAERARRWHHLYWKPLVIVLYGETDADVSDWMRSAAAGLHARVLVGRSLADMLNRTPGLAFETLDDEASSPDLPGILDWMHRSARRWDLLLLDVTNPLPDLSAVFRLQHAAHEYHNDREIGFVTPAYRVVSGETIAGYEIDRASGDVVASGPQTRDYGQRALPRYVLTAAAHGFYATAAAIDAVDLPERHVAGADLNGQIGRLVRQGWAANIRTLCLSSVSVDVVSLPVLSLTGEPRRWFLERSVLSRDGRRKVVFVLNATSISGGIRIVFELANGLAARGFEVEVWSLEGPPAWFDLRVPLKSYRNYDDLLLSLRNVDAIKVATWWETAQVVWLASVNHGIPVYLIQEFETWFYPDDVVGQAAVVSSYRREFVAVTEASYQQAELAEIGVEATLIPNGYDESIFRPLPEVVKDPSSVLAIGRSFFQKNFAMTEEAWRLLGVSGPDLILFGSEPNLLQADRVTYHVRPSDARVNELYNAATVFVQTSRHEGFCLPLLEAMAAGCPVITTDSHGNRDFCIDGVNCIMVPQDDAPALAHAIARLLDDPLEQARLREAGLRTAQQHTWSRILDRVGAFYDEVAERASS